MNAEKVLLLVVLVCKNRSSFNHQGCLRLIGRTYTMNFLTVSCQADIH